MTEITLTFGDEKISATLLDTQLAQAIIEALPATVPLTSWGRELYGPINVTEREEKLTAQVSDGDIAFTSRGNLICFFFGQQPAWEVEVVGKIATEDVSKMNSLRLDSAVHISLQ